MNTEKKTKIVIGVLSVLLILSLFLLAFSVVNLFKHKIAEESVKNNSIGAVEKEWKMEVSNMLPGDSNTKYYEVELKQEENIILCFRADVTNSTNQLEKALFIKVENRESSRVVCDGRLDTIAGQLFEDEILKENNKEQKQIYKITVSMDTSAGNEYSKSSLMMNFQWFLRDEKAEEEK